MSGLDLTGGGDPSDEPRERSTERPERPVRSGPRATSDGAPPGSATAARNAATQAKQEGELSGRIQEALTRIAVALENRSDGQSEMADALRQDGKKMSDAIVNVTRKVKVLRGPVLWVLTIIEPILAFGRVGRIALDKLVGWRGQRMEGVDDGRPPETGG